MNFQDKVASQYENLSRNVGSATTSLSNMGSSLTDSITNLKESVGSSMNEFSSANAVNAGSDFLQSNSIIAKFAFLILVIIVFVFFLRLGIFLIGYLLEPSKNPYLISGLVSGAANITITQNPKNLDSITLQRSNNQTTGIEFTWSTWLIVNDLELTSEDKYSHVFNKGNGEYASNGIATINNGPGVYLSKKTNALTILMNTVSNSNVNETINIENIPLKKWFHLAIRLQNKVMDVYINGIISSRMVFENLPKQNYNDVYVCRNGGFQGSLSDLRYFNYALNVFEINNIVLRGPNLKPNAKDTNTASTSTYSYLSNSWYMSKF
jgi:hypothetical protein